MALATLKPDFESDRAQMSTCTQERVIAVVQIGAVQQKKVQKRRRKKCVAQLQCCTVLCTVPSRRQKSKANAAAAAGKVAGYKKAHL